MQSPDKPGDERHTSETALSLGARLKGERERRNISIAFIAESTKILGALLEGLENDDVSRWPIGFYRRAFFRAYVTAIGLEPEPLLREFAERFPEPQEPLPAPPPASPDRRRRVRVLLSDHASWFVGGPLLERLPPRMSAVMFDVAVLSAIGVVLFVVVDALWAPLSVAALCYYCGSILVLGNTPGVCLYAPDHQPWKSDSSSNAPTAESKSTSIWRRIFGDSLFRTAKSVAIPGWSRSSPMETAGTSK